MIRRRWNQDFPSGTEWTHYLLVAVVAGLLMLWRLGGTALDEHECYVALPAQTMADHQSKRWLVDGGQGGVGYKTPPQTVLNNWMVPVLNGQPRLKKTPLAYWFVALTARVYGTVVNEWTARLPSAIAAVLLCLVTLALGRRMFSSRAALIGAILLAASAGLQKWGRNARPEMLLCLLMTLAMACFYLGLEAHSRGRRVAWMAAFWVAMGLGNLAKEFVPLLLAWPLLAFLFWRQSAHDRKDAESLDLLRKFLIASGIGLAIHVTVTLIPALHWWKLMGLKDDSGAYVNMAMMFGAPMLWYFIRTKGWRQLWPLLPTAIPGTIMMLAIFLPWALYMWHLFPNLAGRTLDQQVIERAASWDVAGPQEYLGALVTLSLPWVAFLPGAFAVGLMKRFSKHRRPLLFLLLWAIGLIGLFSASAGKREHYILPMLPALCLLMGFVVEDVFFRHKWISIRLARIIGCGYGAAGIAGAVAIGAMVIFGGDSGKWLVMLPVALMVAVFTSIAWLEALIKNFRPVVWLLAAAMTVAYLGHHSFVESSWDMDAVVRDFAMAAARKVPPDTEVFSWGEPDANMVFYFGRFIPSAKNPQRASWLFVRPGRGGADTEQLSQWGFQPVLSATMPRGSNRARILYERGRPDTTAVSSKVLPHLVAQVFNLCPHGLKSFCHRKHLQPSWKRHYSAAWL